VFSFLASLIIFSDELTGVSKVSSDSSNSPIISELATISPSDLSIFVITPSD
jgi:hypothetical protein